MYLYIDINQFIFKLSYYLLDIYYKNKNLYNINLLLKILKYY